MTTSEGQYTALAAAAAASGWLRKSEEREESGVPVGAGDVEADRARSGVPDADLRGVPRDTDSEPVGRADAREDARRSGADPDVV